MHKHFSFGLRVFYLLSKEGKKAIMRLILLLSRYLLGKHAKSWVWRPKIKFLNRCDFTSITFSHPSINQREQLLARFFCFSSRMRCFVIWQVNSVLHNSYVHSSGVIRSSWGVIKAAFVVLLMDIFGLV